MIKKLDQSPGNDSVKIYDSESMINSKGFYDLSIKELIDLLDPKLGQKDIKLLNDTTPIVDAYLKQKGISNLDVIDYSNLLDYTNNKSDLVKKYLLNNKITNFVDQKKLITKVYDINDPNIISYLLDDIIKIDDVVQFIGNLHANSSDQVKVNFIGKTLELLPPIYKALGDSNLALKETLKDIYINPNNYLYINDNQLASELLEKAQNLNLLTNKDKFDFIKERKISFEKDDISKKVINGREINSVIISFNENSNVQNLVKYVTNKAAFLKVSDFNRLVNDVNNLELGNKKILAKSYFTHNNNLDIKDKTTVINNIFSDINNLNRVKDLFEVIKPKEIIDVFANLHANSADQVKKDVIENILECFVQEQNINEILPTQFKDLYINSRNFLYIADNQLASELLEKAQNLNLLTNKDKFACLQGRLEGKINDMKTQQSPNDYSNNEIKNICNTKKQQLDKQI